MSGGDWRPTADANVMRHRAAMLARARAWFASQQVLEVQTPLLSSAAVSDPAIESIAVVAGSGRRQFLQTSPEYPMKRLLAAGIGDCYQICPVFRDGESGRLHSPEFTMIEWYRLRFGVEELQRDVAGLLQATTAGLRLFAPARSITYREAIRQSCGLDIRSASVDNIAATLAANGIRPVATADWDIDAWLDLLMGAVVGPGLGFEAPVFVRDYPASQAALARLRADDDGTPVAERFELYVDGVELANGFHELGDADEQRGRFERDLAERRSRGQPLNPLDERLLAALAHGLPGCSGVALGFDRLVLVTLKLPGLASAMSFTDDRA
ncbi:MAG: EF-P lysine aminoacylase EpmA [Pseudomonadota bacterium]|nr:EF-P lysine aminoacylase EpmA [Pseudomonadota bacterium]